MGAALLAIAQSSACFRGDFLDNTCEKLADCRSTSTSTGGTSTGDASTDATVAPTTTTGEGTSGTIGETGTTGPARVEIDGVAFRLDSMTLVDPDIYAPLLMGSICTNVRTDLSTLVDQEFMTGSTNIIMMTTMYDPDVIQADYTLYQKSVCDVANGECEIDPLETPIKYPIFNVDVGECAALDTTVMLPAHVGALNIPQAPCFRTPQASVPLKLGNNFGYINFTLLQMIAGYAPDDQDPADGLGAGVIAGFIRKEDALLINYDLSGTPVNLWSVIAGSDHPDECATEKGAPSDVDMADLDGPNGQPDGVPETVGVWFFLNFTAERVRLFAPV